MNIQTDIFEDYSSHFDLFQKQNDYSEKLLENAKKVKKNIQDVYNNIDFTPKEINQNDFWYFDFDVELKQVSEQPEPGTLKLFTRQYTPVVRVYHNEIQGQRLEFDNKETKYIHKHINELFIGDSISQEYFFDMANQYFLLDFVYNQIKNEDSIIAFEQTVKKTYNDYDKSKKSIICLNCKLQGRILPLKINPNIKSAIDHINTLWNNLSKQSKFILISNYLNYSNENELIILLNENNIISEPVRDYFQNDFLLLNNMEFMNEKPYTMDWNNLIFSPLLLDKKDDKYCLKDIDSIHKMEDCNKKIFFFQKIKDDGMFYKSEIFIPIEDMRKITFLNVISMSHDLLNKKQQEEK
jgi:hypothetical protein